MDEHNDETLYLDKFEDTYVSWDIHKELNENMTLDQTAEHEHNSGKQISLSMENTCQNSSSIMKLNSTTLTDEGNVSDNCKENKDLYQSKISISPIEQSNQPTKSTTSYELLRCSNLSEIRPITDSVDNSNSIAKTKSDSGISQPSQLLSNEFSSTNILNLAFEEIPEVSIQSNPDDGDKIPATLFGNDNLLNLLDVSLSQLDLLSSIEMAKEPTEELTYQKDEANIMESAAKQEKDEVNDPKNSAEHIIPSLDVPIINNGNVNNEQTQQSNEMCIVANNEDDDDQINPTTSTRETVMEDYGKISCSTIEDENLTLLDLTNTSCDFLLSISYSQSTIFGDSIKTSSQLGTTKTISNEIEKMDSNAPEIDKPCELEKNIPSELDQVENIQHEQQQQQQPEELEQKKNKQIKTITTIPIAIRSPLLSLDNKKQKHIPTRIVTPKVLPSKPFATISDRKITTLANKKIESTITSLKKSRLPVLTSNNLKSMKMNNNCSKLPILKRKN
ncbi:hypothetical protein HUG17_1204 [Dermatophagoides farinae]|uniref:Uncharacterized protein n=1 Tax=Dermatophagoides farinae TaxID=6954 RepID=A0A9D4SLA8_DERFA|nr:hypothetical protein HUG17_1204 [Dermatophagoides farinae]